MDLEKYRENGRININKAKEEQVIKFSDTEQRGARKNKFWFNNHKMMYKDIYPETYEDYAELIGYEFAKLLLWISVLLYKNDFMAKTYVRVTSSSCGTTRKEFGVHPESLFTSRDKWGTS